MALPEAKTALNAPDEALAFKFWKGLRDLSENGRKGANPVALWFDQCCALEPGAWTSSAALHASWLAFWGTYKGGLYAQAARRETPKPNKLTRIIRALACDNPQEESAPALLTMASPIKTVTRWDTQARQPISGLLGVRLLPDVF